MAEAPRTLGRYRVVGRLGQGAFGTVHRAHDDTIDRPVAIKQLSPAAAADVDVRERFVREARLLQRGASDRVVRVHDVGEADGRPYLVMELATGGTLADRIDDLRAGRRTVDTAGLHRVLDELGACLVWLEATRLVHRDLKPSNVLVTGMPEDVERGDALLATGERLVLADFGLARRHTETGGEASIAAGTRDYSAPEQFVLGAPVDTRADQFAISGVARAVLDAALAGGLELPPATHDRLQQALDRGLALDPDDRHPNAESWVQAVDAAMAGGQTRRRPSGRRSPRGRRLRRWPVLVALLVAGALAAAGLTLLPDVLSSGPVVVGPDQVRVNERVAFYVDGGGVVDWVAGSISLRSAVLQFQPAAAGATVVTATLADGRRVERGVEVIDDGLPTVTSSTFPLRVDTPNQLDVPDGEVDRWVVAGEVAATGRTLSLTPRTPGLLEVVAVLSDGREVRTAMTVVPS